MTTSRVGKGLEEERPPVAPCPPGASRARQTPGSGILLAHVTSVPVTLFFLCGQSAYLRDRGFEVHAISSPGKELGQFASSEGVECHAVPMARAITPLRDLVALARLWRHFRRLGPAIVDAHTPKAGLLGMMAATLAGVPVRIYHLHGLRMATAHGLQRRLLQWTERIASSLATRVLCVSHSLAAAAVAGRLVPETKIAVLRSGSINGVDGRGRFRPPNVEERRAARQALGIPPDARVLGFVGRQVRDKGVVELAEAWFALRSAMPDLRLLLLGPRELQDPIPDEVAAALQADDRVHAFGFDRDAAKYYRAMDVVALPSYREGFPVVPLEAAAMGLPVVTTRISGCNEAVADGVTGALVPARDAAALHDALRLYLDDAELRRRHGAAARERVLQEFDPERIWEALCQEYRSLWSRSVRERA